MNNPYREEFMEKSYLKDEYKDIHLVASALPELIDLVKRKDEILLKGIVFIQVDAQILWKYTDEEDTEYKEFINLNEIEEVLKVSDLEQELGNSKSKVLSQYAVTKALKTKESSEYITVSTNTTLPEEGGKFILDFSSGYFQVKLPLNPKGDFRISIINAQDIDTSIFPHIDTNLNRVNMRYGNFNIQTQYDHIIEFKLISPSSGFRLLRY